MGDYRRLENPGDMHYSSGVNMEDVNPENLDLHHADTDTTTNFDFRGSTEIFFERVYQYWWRRGFVCMILEDIFQFLQFAFVVLFAVFLCDCVKYDVLFANVVYNTTHKVTFREAFIPYGQCMATRLSPLVVLGLIISSVWSIFWLFKMIRKLSDYREIRDFYYYNLNIDTDMCELHWNEILMELTKTSLRHHKYSPLEICQLMLRRKNYLNILISNRVLPINYDVPLIGRRPYLSSGVLVNIRYLLFDSPWGSPFNGSDRLQHHWKDKSKIDDNAESLSKTILIYGILNLILSPFLLIFTIIHTFGEYAELLKSKPDTFGLRDWSTFGRWYLLHLNELEHELDDRLRRAYRPATKYFAAFTSPVGVVIAKNMLFFAGSILAVILTLSIIDEDVLQVEHMITIAAILGLTATMARSFVADEYFVSDPKLTMHNMFLNCLHYQPIEPGSVYSIKIADKPEVRRYFGFIFQYRFIIILEELLSPIVTPFILIFKLRPRAKILVEFLRRYTVSDADHMGDMLIYSYLNIAKGGNKKYHNPEDLIPQNKPVENDDTTSGSDDDYSKPSSETDEIKAENNGKIEKSLIRFQTFHPDWNPPVYQPESKAFTENINNAIENEGIMAKVVLNDFHTACVNQESYTTNQVPVQLGCPLLDSDQAFQSVPNPYDSVSNNFASNYAGFGAFQQYPSYMASMTGGAGGFSQTSGNFQSVMRGGGGDRFDTSSGGDRFGIDGVSLIGRSKIDTTTGSLVINRDGSHDRSTTDLRSFSPYSSTLISSLSNVVSGATTSAMVPRLRGLGIRSRVLLPSRGSSSQFMLSSQYQSQQQRGVLGGGVTAMLPSIIEKDTTVTMHGDDSEEVASDAVKSGRMSSVVTSALQSHAQSATGESISLSTTGSTIMTTSHQMRNKMEGARGVSIDRSLDNSQYSLGARSNFGGGGGDGSASIMNSSLMINSGNASITRISEDPNIRMAASMARIEDIHTARYLGCGDDSGTHRRGGYFPLLSHSDSPKIIKSDATDSGALPFSGMGVTSRKSNVHAGGSREERYQQIKHANRSKDEYIRATSPPSTFEVDSTEEIEMTTVSTSSTGRRVFTTVEENISVEDEKIKSTHSTTVYNDDAKLPSPRNNSHTQNDNFASTNSPLFDERRGSSPPSYHHTKSPRLGSSDVYLSGNLLDGLGGSTEYDCHLNDVNYGNIEEQNMNISDTTVMTTRSSRPPQFRRDPPV